MNHGLWTDLNREQEAAVRHPGGHLLIVAGAGSGKTRVITCRIAALVEQGVPGERILAITFTNKAAREMRERVERLVPTAGVWLGTFHSFAARALRRGGSAVGLSSHFTICDRDDQVALMRRILKQRGVEPRELRPETVLEQVSGWKNHGRAPDEVKADVAGPADELIVTLYADYEAALRAGDLADFDDLLLLGRNLIVHPTAGESWRRRYEHVLVDEYQDTNPLQAQMALALAEGAGNLTVCGDPDQSIYSWRGADVANILGFPDLVPGTRLVRLEQNYRSTNAILQAASALISHNQQRIERGLFSAIGDGPRPRLSWYPQETDEASAIAREVLRLVQDEGLSWGEIAILFRTNALSRSFETALRYYGVPHVLVGAVEFYSRKEVKDLLAYLRLKVNPRDTPSFLRIVNTPARGLGAVSQGRLLDAAARAGQDLVEIARNPDLRPRLRGAANRGLESLGELLDWLTEAAEDSVAALLEEVMRRTGYDDYLEETYGVAGSDRLENVEALLQEAREFDEAGHEGGLLAFLEERALVQDTDQLERDRQRAVVLMTLHSAKGLEYEAVFLAGLEQDVLPHRRAVDDGALEEERRLLYVGMTRAKRHLALSHVSQRFLYGRPEACRPSIFLDELPPELVERDATPPWSDSWQADSDDSYVVLDEAEGFQVGEMVQHESFGMGEVLDVLGGGIKLRVRFEAGEKLLHLAYTQLRKVHLA